MAHLFRSVAAAYSLERGDHRFQSIAYQRAADAVEHATSEMKDLWEEGKLQEVAGIGSAMASHLDELFKTGRSKHLEGLLKHYPEAVFELMKVPGIGVKSAFKLAKTLGISKAHGAIERLEEAAKKGRVKGIEGFGEDSESKILQSISETKSRSRRLLLPFAWEIADNLLVWLRKHPAVLRAEPLGSLRRFAATVGDIDIAVATKDPGAVVKHFTSYPKKSRVIEAGQASASLMLASEVQADLYLQPPESFGSLLQHLTGSKHHNIALRTYAVKIGYSLSEYGVVKTTKREIDEGTEKGEMGTTWKHAKKGLKKFATEEEFYKYLKMDWIPPELREDNGEIQAALAHQLPNLVELGQIKGDLQIHSNFPIEPSHDLGDDSMESIIEAAEALGYEYLAFTEHNPSVGAHTPAEIIELLKRKSVVIDKINYSREKRSGKGVRKVFNSLEIDIRPDGSLGVPEAGLELLDFALVAIHSSFRGSREEMTKRVLAGLEHPKAKILAHPAARMLNGRNGIDLDWEKVFDFCLKNNKWLEIDAEPARLDLPDVLVKEAVKRGVKLTLGTDSHNKEMLPMMKFGVAVARRGWAQAKDIVNTLPLSQLLPLFS